MTRAKTIQLMFFFIVHFILIQVCSAGDYCINGEYCTYGCCGRWNHECCSNVVAIIIGCCVGFAVLVFVLILVCCLCRRRRYKGTIFRQQNPMVIHSSTVTTHNGVVTTAGVQPGYAYPPGVHGQPVAPYGQTMITYGQPAQGQVPPYPAYAAPPPAYSDVTGPQAQAGVPPQPPPGYYGNENPGFDAK